MAPGTGGGFGTRHAPSRYGRWDVHGPSRFRGIPRPSDLLAGGGVEEPERGAPAPNGGTAGEGTAGWDRDRGERGVFVRQAPERAVDARGAPPQPPQTHGLRRNGVRRRALPARVTRPTTDQERQGGTCEGKGGDAAWREARIITTASSDDDHPSRGAGVRKHAGRRMRTRGRGGLRSFAV